MEAARREDRLGGNPISLDDAYRVLDEVGFTDVAIAVMTAISEVLSYKQDQEKN